MGIRVHKVLGYGLTDVVYDGARWKLTDPRFKRNCALLAGGDGDEAWDDNGRFGVKAWKQFLRAKHDALGKRACFMSAHVHLMLRWLENQEGPRRRPSWLPINCVHHEPEFGKSEVMVIVPPEYSMVAEGWSRHDDAIDYIEETAHREQMTRWEVYRWGPVYPYSGWLDARTGRRLGYCRKHEDVTAFVWHIDYLISKFNDYARPDKLKDKLLRKIVKQMGFKNIREAYQNIIPEVPDGVKLICEFLNLFRKRRTVLQLRPMLYVYWA